MALCSSDSMAQEVSRGPGTFIHPSSPHHLHCFHGIQLPDNFRDDDKDLGLEGCGGKSWLNSGDHAM